KHGEILGEGKYGAAVHRSPAGDDAVAGDFRLVHAEVAGAVFDEHVELFERALVEQQLEPLARGELAALVLRLDAVLAAAHARMRPPPLEFFENVLHRAPNPAPPMPQQTPITAPGTRKCAAAPWPMAEPPVSA